MKPLKNNEGAADNAVSRPDASMQGMIEEARQINENSRKRAAGTRFMSDLITYITAESKRRADSSGRKEVDQGGE